MKAGRMLIMQNWRTLHGRAGGRASTDRTVIGGTITKEAFYSKVRGASAVQRREEEGVRGEAKSVRQSGGKSASGW